MHTYVYSISHIYSIRGDIHDTGTSTHLLHCAHVIEGSCRHIRRQRLQEFRWAWGGGGPVTTRCPIAGLPFDAGLGVSVVIEQLHVAVLGIHVPQYGARGSELRIVWH